MKANTDYVFWRELKDGRPYLTKQQYNTIKGQAKKGLQKILHRKNGR